MTPSVRVGEKFFELVSLMAVLRSEQGCPWDREQDEKSIVNFFLEEVYEVVDAIAQGDSRALAEELGDVLMEVVFLAQIYHEKGAFTIAEVLDGIIKKMTRRHPHVFGPKKLATAEKVREAWQEQKDAEREKTNLFKALPKSAPALLAAYELGQRASASGFDWRRPIDVLAKVREEIAELETALTTERRENIVEEIGDLLFATASLCRLVKVNPELALRRANVKFSHRFAALRKRLREKGRGDLGRVSPREMDRVWEGLKTEARRKKNARRGKNAPRLGGTV